MGRGRVRLGERVLFEREEVERLARSDAQPSAVPVVNREIAETLRRVADALALTERDPSNAASPTSATCPTTRSPR
jgi:hypothetical protein